MDGSTVDAATLVREFRAAEAWIDHVESFRLRLVDHWSGPDPRPDKVAGRGSVEIGFDRHRTYRRWDQDSGPYICTISAWDGQRVLAYERYRKPQPVSEIGGRGAVSDELYAIHADPNPSAALVLGDLAWGRAGPHDFWWIPADDRPGDEFFGAPADFRLAGETAFRGRQCHVLQWDGRMVTLYIGVDDHRLYGQDEMTLPGSAGEQIMALGVEYAAELGYPLRSAAEFEPWLGSLADDRRAPVIAEVMRRARPLFRPQSLQWCDDYQQVAPGIWFPMRQGYDRWDADAVAVGDPPRSSRSEVITAVVVNQPLPEAWFAQDWKEGVPVIDWGHKPPLFYRYKKHFAPAEWQVVLDEANARQADEQDQADQMHSAVGTSAAEFPDAWVQGKPVRLADLSGKVTLVAFRSAGCGPCRNDVAALNRFAEEADATGVGVLSIHAAGALADDVRKAITDENITYPVCIDGGVDPWKGPVFERAHVVRLPSAMVIDRDGRIAAVGILSDAWSVAMELAGGGPGTDPVQ